MAFPVSGGSCGLPTLPSVLRVFHLFFVLEDVTSHLIEVYRAAVSGGLLAGTVNRGLTL